MADDTAFPSLDPTAIAFLEAVGERRTVGVGEYLYRAGDDAYDFFVVLSGMVDIILGGDSDDDEQQLAQHGPGRFLGELNLLTGQRVYVSARVAEPGEVICVPAEV